MIGGSQKRPPCESANNQLEAPGDRRLTRNVWLGEIMKRALHAAALLSLVCLSAPALDIDPFKGPMPIAVLIQTDPWLMVIGSDLPMAGKSDVETEVGTWSVSVAAQLLDSDS